MIHITDSASNQLTLIKKGEGSLGSGVNIVSIDSFTCPPLDLNRKIILTLDAIAANIGDTITASAGQNSGSIDPSEPLYCGGINNHVVVKNEIQTSPANSTAIDIIKYGSEGFGWDANLSAWGDMTVSKTIFINVQQVGSVINFCWSAFIQG